MLRGFSIQIELDFDCKIKDENFRGVKAAFVLKFYGSKHKHLAFSLRRVKKRSIIPSNTVQKIC